MAHFVGRAHESDLLRSRYDDAAAGRPQTVLVHGSPGLGKTALLDAFVASLAAVEARVASGDLAERTLRFGLLGQLLRVRAPEWADPFAAGADLLRFLDAHADGEPTVFVVDDAHLADPESLAALTFALRRLGPDRVLAVLSARTDEMGQLPSGLTRLVQSRGTTLRLGGLSEDDCLGLASALGVAGLSRRAAARLVEHTAGSPLYLKALLDELPLEALERSGHLPAPSSYAMLVLSRVAALSPNARRLVSAASVLGSGCRLEDAAAVANVADAESSLDELTSAHILTCTYAEDGWTLAFEHPLARAALHDDLGPHDRRTLHLRAARRGNRDQALEHRYAASSGTDADLARDLAERAGELRSDDDLRSAADFYLKAGRVAGGQGEPWLMESAALFLTLGDLGAARAAEASIEGTPTSASRFYLRARIAWFGGEPREAAELAEQAWQRADQLDPAGRGGLAAILAQLHNIEGDGLAAASWAERALAEELTPEDADLTSAARALGLMIAGLPDEARAALTALPDDPAETTPHQHHQLAARGALRAVLDDLPGARADLAVLVRSSPSDVAPERLLGMGVLAEVCYRLGDWDRAVALADQALSLAEDSEQVWVQGYLHAVAGLLAGARGGQQRAADHLDAGLTLAEQLGDPATWAVCQNLAVHLAAFRAEPELVLERAQPLDALRIPPLEEPGWLGWPVQHAGALVQLGRLDDAREALDRLAELARARGSKSRLAALARVSGELATSLRDHTEARAAFEEAVALSERAESLEWAAIRSSYGRFLRRRGERRSARAQLQAAYDRFHALGATPYLQVCAEELAACGATPDAGPPTALDDLTPQEQVVVRLVAEGMSNPEIARQLVLSVKTVGYHLSNAYTKLGVHSRTQLLARVGAVVGPTV